MIIELIIESRRSWNLAGQQTKSTPANGRMRKYPLRRGTKWKKIK